MRMGSGPVHTGRNPVMLRKALGVGDFSSDISKIGTDLSAGDFSMASQDPVLNVPAWVWLSGAVIAYMFLFTGGPESRVSRSRRASKAAAKAAREAYAYS